MPPKKKKLTKKEKQRLADEYEKLARAQVEQERLKQLKEEKEHIERERKLAKEKEKKEIAEQELRVQQLSVSCSVLGKLKDQISKMDEEMRAAEEWKKYMKCDGLPDPASFSQMNTYLFLWTRDDSTNDIDHVLQKTDEVIQLLNVMDELIDDPPPRTPGSNVEEWKEIRSRMRIQQQRHLDTATYRLLRNIEHNLTPIDLTASKLLRINDHFLLSLWAGIPAPISVAQATEVKQNMTIEFPEMGVSCILPVSVARHDMAIRALWLKYDHWSDQCPSYNCPPLLPNNKDLNQATLDEWKSKCDMQKVREDEEKDAKRKGKRSSGTAHGGIERPITEIILALEEEESQAWKKKMKKETGSHQVNLRKYCVLGGVLFLDLLEQPPQPQDLRGKYTITILDKPPGLNLVPYYEHYVPPPAPEPGVRRTPEEIEVEVKKHEEALEKIASVTLNPQSDKKLPAEELRREMEKERQLQKLLVVSVELSESVLWFEPPLAANWDPEHGYWSTEEIHDLKFNEDKQMLTFRSGRMGLMALIAYRYCNLPYQSWELIPDFKGPPGGVVFTITASVVILEFIIREDKVCLNQLQNGATGALQEIVGTFHKPKQLIKLMQRGGVDVFPPPDAICYVEGSTNKHRTAEHHLYHCMALFSTCFNFAWSRWNLLAGLRNMVLQMRESLDRKRLRNIGDNFISAAEGNKNLTAKLGTQMFPAGILLLVYLIAAVDSQPNYSIVHVTPLRAAIVNCTEVSPSFNDASVDDIPMKLGDTVIYYNFITARGLYRTRTQSTGMQALAIFACALGALFFVEAGVVDLLRQKRSPNQPLIYSAQNLQQRPIGYPGGYSPPGLVGGRPGGFQNTPPFSAGGQPGGFGQQYGHNGFNRPNNPGLIVSNRQPSFSGSQSSSSSQSVSGGRGQSGSSSSSSSQSFGSNGRGGLSGSSSQSSSSSSSLTGGRRPGVGSGSQSSSSSNTFSSGK